VILFVSPSVGVADEARDANVRVTVDLEWASHGAVQIVGGKLLFPLAPAKPGIYRFTLRPTSAESVYIGETDGPPFRLTSAESVYIGETVQLRRRFAHYRNPGPTQFTNQRMNAAMKSLIENGGKVELETATQIRVDINGRVAVADLAHRPYRLLAENAALVIAREAGQTVKNL
jgi:hypothetical protein